MNVIKTNKDRLVKMAVMGEVNHPTSGRGYRVDWDGKPRVGNMSRPCRNPT